MESSASPALNVIVRILLFIASLVALILMVTAKQSENILIAPSIVASFTAKFNQSPANKYFVAATAYACLYSLVSVLACLSNPRSPKVALGLLASATGTVGGVGYVAWKGNDAAQWKKICNVYDTYCGHIAASLAFSFFASILLLLLTFISARNLYLCTNKS